MSICGGRNTGDQVFIKSQILTICGIGLSNVRRVVNKYEGKIFIDHADRVFTVSLMLNLGFSAAPEIEEGPQKRRIQVLTSQFEQS